LYDVGFKKGNLLMQNLKLIDRHGKPIAIGDIVRIVALSPEFIANFPQEDQMLIDSMVGKFFKIYGIDEFGHPWVSREWHDEAGLLQSHIIALDPEEMERV
jgi:hypothetical protein